MGDREKASSHTLRVQCKDPCRTVSRPNLVPQGPASATLGSSFPAHLGANEAVGQCAFPSRPPESHLPPTVTSKAERTKDSSPHHFSWASGWLQSAQPFHPSESHSRNNAPAETTADRLRRPPSGCLVGNFLTRGFLFLLFPLLVPVLKAFWKRGVLVQAASAFHKFFIGRFFRKWSGAQKFNHIILI